MNFKRWDIVKCIPEKIEEWKNGALCIDIKYIVESQDRTFVCLFEDSIGNKLVRYYPYRFKKVPIRDLTEEEAFRIIKYKLGAKID